MSNAEVNIASPHRALPIASLLPCCLAVSSDYRFDIGETAESVTRQWRALGLDGRSELFAGSLQTNAGDPLVVVRDKAIEVARRHGYEPQQFVLEHA